ncbi:preprotein translocase subunit YajC [Cellulosimicrobium protaetiae]|uniref:Preprotein translocase subunit YajC n=1 Tax=Cellulosimicrobium protaetiae TaxID=2587808 RepID=A0A6M5UH14_9MICO|nr:preprotein translocase subunit YajC [Cellulosimicrobium protaetiae]QJW36882.1 preprotein translocase subunit YajC [Cellulosimicrobium protaetiae]
MDISFILILALAAGAMFLMTSRTRKQQREAQSFRANLAPGQEVMTGSGMFGTIVDVDEEADVITIESTPGNQSRWLRAAVAKLVEPPVEAEETDEASEEDTEYGSADPGTSTSKGDVDDLVVPDDLSGLTDDGSEKDRGRRDDGTDTK